MTPVHRRCDRLLYQENDVSRTWQRVEGYEFSCRQAYHLLRQQFTPQVGQVNVGRQCPGETLIKYSEQRLVIIPDDPVEREFVLFRSERLNMRKDVAPQEDYQRHIHPPLPIVLAAEFIANVGGDTQQPHQEIRLVLDVVTGAPRVVEIVNQNSYFVAAAQY
jgi:hypothetical protein